MLDVVICIPTCRRPTGLKNLLHHIAEIEFSGSCAIVVVDNDKKKQGLDICTSLSNYRWPLTCVPEIQPGIAYAMNSAVSIALRKKTRFIAILDDDEWPCQQWLSELMHIQKKYNSDAVGGPVLPVFPNNAMPWSNLPQYFGTDQRLTDGAQTILFASGNFLVRASCIQEMMPEPFDPVSVRGSSGDQLFFRNLDKLGYKMHWAAEALVYETVAYDRLNIDWLKRRQFRAGNNNVQIQRLFETSLSAECVRLIKTGGLFALSCAYFSILFWHPKHRIHSTLLFHKALGKAAGHVGIQKKYSDHGGPRI